MAAAVVSIVLVLSLPATLIQFSNSALYTDFFLAFLLFGFSVTIQALNQIQAIGSRQAYPLFLGLVAGATVSLIGTIPLYFISSSSDTQQSVTKLLLTIMLLVAFISYNIVLSTLARHPAERDSETARVNRHMVGRGDILRLTIFLNLPVSPLVIFFLFTSQYWIAVVAISLQLIVITGAVVTTGSRFQPQRDGDSTPPIPSHS